METETHGSTVHRAAEQQQTAPWFVCAGMVKREMQEVFHCHGSGNTSEINIGVRLSTSVILARPSSVLLQLASPHPCLAFCRSEALMIREYGALTQASEAEAELYLPDKMS